MIQTHRTQIATGPQALTNQARWARRALALSCLIASTCVGPTGTAREPAPAGPERCKEALPPWPNVPRDAQNVTSFGAQPDDERDDTEAIQRALRALKPGGWLIFPKGRYLHRTGLSVSVRNAVLWSEGATLHATNPEDQALFLRADGARVYRFTLTAVTSTRLTTPQSARLGIFAAEGGKAPLRGNVLRGNSIVAADPGVPTLANGASSAGIFVYGARDFLVAENRVERSLADGIHVTAGSGNGLVVGNVVRQTGDDMIGLVSYCPLTAAALANPSELRDVIAKGLVEEVLVAGNDVSDQYWGRGISVVGGRNITIERNAVRRTPYAAAILVAREQGYQTCGAHNVLIRDNVVSSVQTEPPSYRPPSAANWRLTGHAAIEIHALSSREERDDPRLRKLIDVGPVYVSRNEVRGSRFNGIRIGDASEGQLVHDIRVSQNSLRAIGETPFSSASGVSCRAERNLLEGRPLRAELRGSAAAASGAGRSCARP